MTRSDAIDAIRRRRTSRPASRRLPRAQPPDGVRRSYYAALRGIVERLAEIAEARLAPVLATLPVVRADAPADGDIGTPPRDFEALLAAAIAAAGEEWAAEFPLGELERLGERIATETSDQQKREWRKQAIAAVGVDPVRSEPWLVESIDRFTAENIALIRSIPTQALGEVQEQVLDATRRGLRHETLAESIRERMGVAKSRAALIARDQVGKFSASLATTRQRAAGVTAYTWRTVNDNRVRSEHEDRNNVTYAWTQADATRLGVEYLPPDEQPGIPVQCRCYAEPDMSQLLEFNDVPAQMPAPELPSFVSNVVPLPLPISVPTPQQFRPATEASRALWEAARESAREVKAIKREIRNLKARQARAAKKLARG